jgi:transcriptional regulator with XRE-family HTH domain
MPRKPIPRKTPKTEAACDRFGKRIAALRTEKSWTQMQLSEKTGLDQGFISRVESGKMEPCLGSLVTLAAAFGISASELLKGV